MAEISSIDPNKGLHEASASTLYDALAMLWRTAGRRPFGIKHHNDNRLLLTKARDHSLLGPHQLLVTHPGNTLGHPRHVLGFFALEETGTPLRVLDIRPTRARELSQPGIPPVDHSDIILLAGATRDAWVDQETPVDAIHRMGERVLATLEVSPVFTIPLQRQTLRREAVAY